MMKIRVIKPIPSDTDIATIQPGEYIINWFTYGRQQEVVTYLGQHMISRYHLERHTNEGFGEFYEEKPPEPKREEKMVTNLPAVKNEMSVVATTPREQINQAAEMAKLLKDVVKQAGLSKKLGGTKEHLEFEAWQTIARWHHCTPSTEWTKPILEGDKIVGWEARVNVLDETGRVIGSSEGMCMADEKNWKGKPSYALRSMAQTRTAGKALRSLFAHVAVLAGYSATPAEEMDGVSVSMDSPQPIEVKHNEMPEQARVQDLASDAQRKALFAKCMERWNDRDRAKAFADYLLETAGLSHFTKKFISDCLDDFDSMATDFEQV